MSGDDADDSFEKLGDVARRVFSEILAKRNCRRCDGCSPLFDVEAKNARLMRNITASGASLVHWRCLNCDRPIEQPGGGYWIAHEKVEAIGIKIVVLPIAENQSSTLHCEKCGHSGAEIHHWAPRHIFGKDSDTWPTSPLCVRCHREWHDRTGI